MNARLERGPSRLLVIALAATLVLLLAHAASYFFLTDDAFISFRYARNLAHGHGLVFNPGQERVEGYSNFLWVLILAGLDRVGWVPESAAPWLSLAATVVLWALVAWWALRRPLGHGSHWLALVPLVWLAANRSVAVWSTSGLETRWFEVFVIAGVIRLALELESAERRPRAAWLFGLACWTRPDGIVIAAAAYAAAALWRIGRRRFDGARFLVEVAPLLAMVAVHFAFRRAYYGEWLPNTYYAKVGGRQMWAEGARYLALFALEYGAWLWLPLLVAGVVARVRQGRGDVPLLFGAVIVLQVLYVAAIGGDHFEYRPLDVAIPFVFLLLADGVRALARDAKSTAVAVAYAGLVLFASWWLPFQSHRQFPDRYVAGFPGRSIDARGYLDPAADPIMRLPGLRAVAETHRALLCDRTKHFVGVRQEEHRMFLASALAQGRELKRLEEQHLLPPDVSIAMDCVGAIPYATDFRTLDRLGLTDRVVAHSAFHGFGSMAHDKRATIEYAAERSIDLWPYDLVSTVCPVTSPSLVAAIEAARTRGARVYAAEVEGGRFVLCEFPAGFERGALRFPRLHFREVGEEAFVADYLPRAKAAYRESLAVRPEDLPMRRRLAYLEVVSGELTTAVGDYERVVRASPEDAESWEFAGVGWDRLGDSARARESFERGLAAARRSNDSTQIARLGERLAGR